MHCVSIQISLSLGKEFLRLSRLRKIAVTRILVRIYVYLCSLFSQILEILLNGFDFYFDLFWMSWHWNQLLKYCICFIKFSDHDFAGSSIHPIISAPSAILSSFPASQTTSLNVLPTTSTQKISATRAINTPSINASQATESHSLLPESSIRRGKD